MRPLPEGVTETQWAALIGAPHTLAVRVEVLLNGQVVVDSVPVQSGTITLDATAGRYGRLNCQIITPDRLPATTSDRYTPSGFELRVSRGVTWVENGVRREALVPLGVFPIATSAIDVPGKVTTISAWDRSWLIQRAKFEDYYHIFPGTNYATAITDLLQDRRPGTETNFPSIEFDTPHLVFDGFSDPWAGAQRMTRSCGYGLRYDGVGVAEMVPDAMFSDTPAATLTTTRNAITVAHSLDAENTFNAQTVRSSNASTMGAFSATVVDDDPQSLTWWGGPFGHVPADPVQSEYAVSAAHCEAEARSRLATTRGIASSLDATAAPDPRWEASDVILVDIPELGMTAPHILDAVTIGLTPADPMTVRTRTRQVITLG